MLAVAAKLVTTGAAVCMDATSGDDGLAACATRAAASAVGATDGCGPTSEAGGQETNAKQK